jgi:hypothetical protein
MQLSLGLIGVIHPPINLEWHSALPMASAGWPPVGQQPKSSELKFQGELENARV